MKRRLFWVCVAAFLTSSLIRAEIVTIALPQIADVYKAELHYEAGYEAKNGILVLCPGMNGDGKVLVSEAQWRSFAESNGLGLVGVSFSSKPELIYSKPARGYFYPEQGAGNALLAGLAKIYKGKPQLFYYGFSAGAQFGSRFADQNADRMGAWATYSASFWAAPVSAGPSSAPGLVACGEFDAERYGPSFAYFQQGRRKDARWTWVSLGNTGHFRHRRFEDFVRAYFAAILGGKFDKSNWLDAETKQPVTEDDRLLNPALAVWLPTAETIDLWLKLHHP